MGEAFAMSWTFTGTDQAKEPVSNKLCRKPYAPEGQPVGGQRKANGAGIAADPTLTDAWP